MVDKHRASIPESARGPGPASRFDALSSVEATAPARQQQQWLLFFVSGGGGHTSPGQVYRARCSGGYSGGYIAYRQRSILEVHGCLVPWSVGSMPVAERVGDGAGGRLLCTLFWYIVIVL